VRAPRRLSFHQHHRRAQQHEDLAFGVAARRLMKRNVARIIIRRLKFGMLHPQSRSSFVLRGKRCAWKAQPPAAAQQPPTIRPNFSVVRQTTCRRRTATVDSSSNKKPLFDIAPTDAVWSSDLCHVGHHRRNATRSAHTSAWRTSFEERGSALCLFTRPGTLDSHGCVHTTNKRGGGYVLHDNNCNFLLLLPPTQRAVLESLLRSCGIVTAFHSSNMKRRDDVNKGRNQQRRRALIVEIGYI